MTTPQPRPRVLIVDDDLATRLSLASPLRESGYEITEAGTVAGALAALAGATPSACVLDLSLDADASGLHEALTARQVPTLLVSGVEREALTTVATPRGWSYLGKPFDHTALLASVAALLPAPEGAASTRERTGQRTLVESLLATAVDVLAILTLRTVLLTPHLAEWLQALCILGILLLAGVRLAELGATLRGLPTRGGPGALVVALGSALAARAGSGS